MKKRTVWFLVIGVAAVAVGAAGVGALALVLRGGGGVASRSYLYLDLDGEVPEQPAGAELGSLFERRPPSLRALVDGLDRAASDSRIASVVLRVGSLPDSGWASVQELRDGVARFRRS